MKVLQINPYPPEHLGGSEIFCRNLAINLKKQKNIDSDILTSDVLKRKVKTDYINENIKIIYKKCYFNLWGKNPVVNVSNFINHNYQNYDLIHAHSYIFFTSFQAALLKRIRRYPLIVHIHGGVQTPLSKGASFLENIQITLKQNFYDKIIGRYIIEKADAIISVSNKDLNLIKNRYNIENKLSKHIPNAVDVKKFQKNEGYERKYITFIGRLSYIKGIDQLLDLIKDLYKFNDKLKFLIIGNGPLRNLVEIAQKELPITHMEFFPYAKIEEIYNMSKLIMITSRFEGIPTTLLESLACETPIIASNVGGISEIVKPYENGYLLDDNQNQKAIDFILRLIDDKKLLTSLGKNGRKLIEDKYSWEKVIEKTEEIYNKVL